MKNTSILVTQLTNLRTKLIDKGIVQGLH